MQICFPASRSQSAPLGKPLLFFSCYIHAKGKANPDKSWQQLECRHFLDLWTGAGPNKMADGLAFTSPQVYFSALIQKAKSRAQQVVKHRTTKQPFCDYMTSNDDVCHEGIQKNTVSQNSVKILSMRSQCVPGSLSRPRREEPGDEAKSIA